MTAENGACATADVCLVTMPYASLPRPSLALGLLKQILRDAGITATAVYANLWFAERVGIRQYHVCSHGSPTEFLAGEWTFAEAAFGANAMRDDTYLEAVSKAHRRVRGYGGPEDGERLAAELLALRDAANGFVDDAARRIVATRPRIVGCTSTFEQHVASLALLRRVRELDPSIVTMLGGANCEAEMGRATHRCFPWVDFVVSGEADGLIAELCRLVLAAGRDVDPALLPYGVFGPQRPDAHASYEPGDAPRADFRQLDALPVPDFSDYFGELNANPVGAGIFPGLPLETSRGCWWGAVHQCTFCGLNGNGMAYRSKSPDRVVHEVRTLEERYGIKRFESVDNILDYRYFTSVLPRLAEDGAERRVFYEVKANLNRRQIAAMRDAGITWVQPGIESLHSGVLKLMDKGIQGWQNVQLLKWAREAGLRLSWGMLWGFPGEDDAWYEQVASWLPALEHLQPPGGLIRLRYDRFSVYHRTAAERGLKLTPISAMSLVYPLADEDLAELTYFFVAEGEADLYEPDRGYTKILRRRPGVARVLKLVHGWRMTFWRGIAPVLSMNDRDGALELCDSRSCAEGPFRTTLRGLSRAVCLACDDAPVAGDLRAKIASDFGIDASQDEIDAVVDELVRRRVVIDIDRRLVTVAVRGQLPELPMRDQFPGGFVRDLSAPPPDRLELAT